MPLFIFWFIYKTIQFKNDLLSNLIFYRENFCNDYQQ